MSLKKRLVSNTWLAIPDFQWKLGIAKLTLNTTQASTGCLLKLLVSETPLPTAQASTSQCSLTSRAATNLEYSEKNMLAICERMKREKIHTLDALIVVFMVEGNDGGNRGIKDGWEIWQGNQEITKIYILRSNSVPLGADAKMPKCHLFSRWKVSSGKKDDTSAFRHRPLKVWSSI